MLKFKDYTTPPPNGPYQLGDIAVVANFIPKGAQGKGSLKNVNKIGTVIGYKNVPGAYSKYLLQFDDNSQDAYMPSYLKGPLLNREIAQTYVNNPNKLIEPSDIKTKSGKVLSNEWETNPRVEEKLKHFLTEVLHLTWYDQPIRIADQPVIVFKLAGFDHDPNIGLFRNHNRTTRKLKSFAYNNRTRAKGYELILPMHDSLTTHKSILSSPFDKSDLSMFSIDEILNNANRHFTREYINDFNKVFYNAIQLKSMRDRLPELNGLL